MKCKFCKAKIQENDEICPECGKLLTESDEVRIETSAPERTLGKNIKFYDCKSLAIGYLFSGCCVGAFLCSGGIIYIRNHPYFFESLTDGTIGNFGIWSIILIIVGIVAFAFGICSFLTVRKCFVCINQNGVYGIKPKFYCKEERFEFFYEDITDFTCRIPIGRGTPRVKVEIGEKKFVICILNNSDASFLASYIRENMPEKKLRK
ncbi:MAG: hypothetical protein IKM25_06785 [Clostridia bacterium]|nr:hypothetical protein [Clostridia bacterium]